jgi:hypothetical protein
LANFDIWEPVFSIYAPRFFVSYYLAVNPSVFFSLIFGQFQNC